MKQVFKKAGILAIAGLLFAQAPASATTLSDLKEQQKQVEQQQSELNSSISEKTSEINTNQSKQSKLLEQIQTLNAEIEKTNNEIAEVTKSIQITNEEIEKLQASIVALQIKIDERNALLEERARAIQAGGTVSYVDVLLGANSFVDFIDRISAVSTLIDADRQIMREQKADQMQLEEEKASLENKKLKLEENQAKLQSLKASLDGQKQQKNQVVAQLEAEQAKLQSEKQLLQEEYSEALTISAELEAQISKEQARLAEIARQEALKKAQAAQKSSGGGAVTSTGNAPAVSAGTWTKPANGVLTSGYGWRNIGAGNEFHYGVDIANRSGTPIVAAADGVVSYASALSTYGNVIMVTHSINGQTWTTLYAHLSGYSTSVGQVVSKGQQIGLMGSTGRSTGPHLHFEMHTGTWQGQTRNVVNPMGYVNF